MNFQKTAMVLPKMHFLLQKIHKKHRDRKIFALDRICKIKGLGGASRDRYLGTFDYCHIVCKIFG